MLNVEKIKFEMLSELRGAISPFETIEVVAIIFYKELMHRGAIRNPKCKIKEFKDAWYEKRILKLFEGLSNDELKECLLSILNDSWKSSGKIYQGTPADLNDLIFKLFEFEGGDMFADLGCGNGTFLSNIQYTAYKQGIIFKETNGIEINLSDYYIASLLGDIFENDCCHIINCDALKEQKIMFNKGYCFPPIGVKAQCFPSSSQFSRYGYKFTPRSSSEWMFIDRMLSCIESDYGFAKKKGIAVLSPRCFYNDEDREYRDLLIRKGKIEAIIELPCGVLKSTTIKSCVVIFSNDNKTIKMVDASNVMGEDPTRFLNAQLPVNAVLDLFKSTSGVECSKLLGRNNLLPSSYNLSNKTKFSGTPLYKLADIITGCQYTLSYFEKSFAYEPTGYRILTSSDINNGSVDWNNLRSINIKDDKLDRYVLQRGDVVLTSKSSKVKTVVVDEDLKEKIIVTGGMLIIRSKSNVINPIYIKVYLDSANGKLALKIIQKGVSIVSINAKDLGTILIPNITLEKQNDISNIYIKKLSKLNLLKEELKNVENSINTLLEDEMEESL